MACNPLAVVVRNAGALPFSLYPSECCVSIGVLLFSPVISDAFMATALGCASRLAPPRPTRAGRREIEDRRTAGRSGSSGLWPGGIARSQIARRVSGGIRWRATTRARVYTHLRPQSQSAGGYRPRDPSQEGLYQVVVDRTKSRRRGSPIPSAAGPRTAWSGKPQRYTIAAAPTSGCSRINVTRRGAYSGKLGQRMPLPSRSARVLLQV